MHHLDSSRSCALIVDRSRDKRDKITEEEIVELCGRNEVRRERNRSRLTLSDIDIVVAS